MAESHCPSEPLLGEGPAAERLSVDQIYHGPGHVNERAQFAEMDINKTGGHGGASPSSSCSSPSLQGVSATYNVNQPPETPHLAQRKRSPGVLHLPTELLTRTFSHFQHPGIHQGKLDVNRTNLDFTDGRKVIQNIRLVCQAFNIIASQFLFPVFHIWLDDRSMSRIQTLTQNPLLQSGLYVIQVHSEYYLYDLAKHETPFWIFARDEAWHLTHQMTLPLGQDDINTDPSLPAKRKIILAGLRAINTAAHRLLGGLPGDIFTDYTSNDEELIDEYKQTLEAAYRGYKSRCHAQYQITGRKLIVQALARLVPGLKHKQALSLSFVQMPGKTLASGVLEGAEGVYQSLIAPQTWEHLGKMRAELLWQEIPLQTQILWDLPIAIHQAGGSLVSLKVADALVTQGYSLVCAKKLDLRYQDCFNWSDLPEACKALETVEIERLGYSFKLGNHNLPSILKNNELAKHPIIPIAEYLEVILSGDRLRSIALNTAIEEMSQFSGHRDRCPLGPSLAQLNCRSVTTISLSNIGISQAHLEQLCQNLSQKIKKITLIDIALIEGSWENILELLREKLMGLYSVGKCAIDIDEWTGGEIDSWVIRIKEPSGPGDADELELARIRAANSKIMKVIAGYVKGTGLVSNPIPIQMSLHL